MTKFSLNQKFEKLVKQTISEQEQTIVIEEGNNMTKNNKSAKKKKDFFQNNNAIKRKNLFIKYFIRRYN